ncbi:hypothetical protein PHYPO_G00111960 [Pangasianodon hypophthalmus]|uniref:PDZ domain-containing protein n=1 Tax=Pangasianodon hypophthalmus TaxID=310915 RepID=A0A5N5L3R8_PANHP|nr:hypothetical protein PHYPO_G00111960 [Pangasianodon hypophthalmus]
MSKAMQKKNHWSARVSECAVRRDARGDINVPLQGGAENGEFVYVGRVDPGSISYDHGTLTEGELLLEVDTLPVSGLPLYDVLSAVKNSKDPLDSKPYAKVPVPVFLEKPNPSAVFFSFLFLLL